MKLEIVARAEGTERIIELIDNGAGVDAALVREAARSKKLCSNAELALMSDEEVLQLLFQPGFSVGCQEVTLLPVRLWA